MEFTEDERTYAFMKAKEEINERAKFARNYKRGFNDCIAFLMVYDSHLRAKYSEAYKYINFEWNNSKQFLIKLYKSNMTLPKLAQTCGYKVITGERPALGDIAFEQGTAMVAEFTHWYSPTEDNSGIKQKRRLKVKETCDLLARPIRS